MNDVRKDPAAHSDRYAFEVQRRAMLELLAEEADALPPEQVDLLKVLDRALRGMFKAGGFTGPAEHQNQFPPEKFWYLYGGIEDRRMCRSKFTLPDFGSEGWGFEPLRVRLYIGVASCKIPTYGGKRPAFEAGLLLWVQPGATAKT